MVLKRYYTNGQVTHVKIIHAKDMQRFSMRFVKMGIEQGWIKMQDGDIIINAEPRKVFYRIVRYHGIYCCFCNLSLPEGGVMARSHIATCHDGHDSPDKSNPAGYRYDNFYQCVKEP